MLYQQVDRCRACGSTDIPEVLSLGDFALSDFLNSPEDHTDRAPLTLLRCEGCTLVQLAHTVQRERLYSQYWYRSSTQPAMVQALQDIVRDAQGRVPLQSGDLVLDIGANDGTLLAQYPEGIIRLAYEPALNLWAPLAESGARVVGGFFPPRGTTAYKRAKIITSVACFYDVDDPGAFVKAIKERLAEGGVWINQMAYLPDTLEAGNFGDICHEHLTYWTVWAFDQLLAKHGLEIRDADFNAVNGGSVRLVVGHGEHRTQFVDSIYTEDLAAFSRRIEAQRTTMQRYMTSLKASGSLVVGYGASTKGNTYLQYWGIGPDLLECIADRNPDKWGKYTPSGQRVISEADMRAMQPAYLLVLPWHFLDAFVDREKDLLAAGTRMVVPFPKLHLIGGDDAAILQKVA